MNEIGDKLKEARKAKGYTLDDLQQMTKIQKRYLIAVEEGNLDVLPGNFYARAFIKQYADTVGLNGEELLKEYTEHIPNAKDETYNEKVKATQTRSKAKDSGVWSRVQDSLPTILIIILVIAIAIAIYIASTQSPSEDDESGSMINETEETVEVENNDDNDDVEEEPAEESEDDENTDDENTDEEQDEEDSEDDEEQTTEVTESTGASTTYTVTGTHPDEQTISLSAEGGDSWVSITIDNEIVDQGLLSSGQSMEANFGSNISQIDIVVGNAPATVVQLNGETLNYAEESAGIVRQDLQIIFE